MGDAPAQPIRKPGWYRWTTAGWEYAAPPGPQPDGDPLDLVLVEDVAEDVPLW
jgi:hypothetical protein